MLRSLAVGSVVLVGALLPGTAAWADDSSGTTVVGRLVQAWPEAGVGAHEADGPISWVQNADGDAVRIPTEDVDGIPAGSTVQVTVSKDGDGNAADPLHQVIDSQVVAPAATDPYGPGASSTSVAGGLELAAAARALREAAGDEYAHLVPDHDREPAGEAPAAEDGARPSHAHQAVFLPGGVVATTDMGLDLVRVWRVRPAGLVPLQDVVLPKGSGPRHMVWHPSGHLYVVTELSHEIFALAPDEAGTWHLVAGTPLGAGILPDDTAAELGPSRDGAFLYAGVRGSDTIAVVGVRGEGNDLRPIALVEAGVHWPRHHVVMRDSLLVAGQLSDDIASLGIDLRTGVPGRVRHRSAAPSPTCLLAAR
jgi:hypothetical protein